MSRTKGALRAVTAVVAGVSLAMLAGCGGSKPESSVAAADGTKAASASSPDATSTARPSATSTPSPTLPSGYRWRSLESAHVTFAAPRSWSALKTGDSLGSRVADAPEVKLFAERMGITVEQFSRAIAQIDLMLVGPSAKGYAPNLQSQLTQLAELPSYEAVTADLEKAAEDHPRLRYFDTAAGKAMDATYIMQVGTATVHCRTMWVNTPSGVVTVTVAGLTPTSTSDIADAVESTIHSV